MSNNNVKQGKGMESVSVRLHSIAREIQSLKQKALTAIHLVGYTLLLSHITFIPYAHAAPTGGTVVGGTGTITQTGITTDIYQASSSMAIDWNTYDLNSNEIVNYYQPGSDSLSLNRILSNNPSQIYGQINANGQVILVNPNGLFFGEGASVNVGGLIASGLDISPNDFMNGNYLFNEVLGTNGTVINNGLINAATGGNITLLGKQIQNQGVISANLGAVNLAAGKQAVLTFDNQGLIGISVTQDILQNELGIDPAILNSGTINASGGRILLTASQSQDIFSKAVNTGGLTQATSVVVNADGTFDLTGGADVLNSGTINTSTTQANSNGGTIALLGQNITSSGTITADAQQNNGGNIELHSVDTTLLTNNSITSARSETQGQGGIVKILGDKVGLFDQSQIDVTGANGGGQALIGGDYQGQNSLIRNASRTYVSTNANIIADALQNGDGGKIINWGNDYTWFYGSASATGGANAGNGGFVEISGKGLSFDGAVDTTAANGSLGTLLFDPMDIVVHGDSEGSGGTNNGDIIGDNEILWDDGDPSADTFDITEGTLEGLLDGANIVLEAARNITINVLDDDTGNGVGDLSFTNDIALLTILADANHDGDGYFQMATSNEIITHGGSVSIEGATITAGAITTTGAQAESGGAVTLISTAASGTAIEVGVITSMGGTAGVNSSGETGGQVEIVSAGGDVTIASIDTSGSNGSSVSFNDGGAAGDIGIYNSGAITINGVLTATGGAAGTAGYDDSGVGGNITIAGITSNGANMPPSTSLANSAGTVQISGNITAHGGDVTINAASIVAGSSDIDTSGAKTDGSSGVTSFQNGGTVNLNTTGSIAVNAITTDGGTEINNDEDGRDAGDVIISTTNGNITVNNGISAKGGLFTGSADGIGGDGGKIRLTSNNGSIQITGNINSSGSNGYDSGQNFAGGSAGTIGLGAGSTITVDGTLTANGGQGVGIGSDGAGGDITIGGVDTDSGTPMPSGDIASGAVVTGDITAYGKTVTINAASIAASTVTGTNNIDTSGLEDQSGGAVSLTASSGSISTGNIDTSGDTNATTNGGDVTVTASSGEVSINGGITTDGSSGNAGIIDVSAGATGANAMSITGDISAQGTSTGSDYITLTANNGTMTLGGDITASGSTDANITLSANTVVIDDGGNAATQTFTGQTIDITSSNALQLKESLKLDAVVDAAIHGNIDYNDIGTAGSLTIWADNDVSYGGISDSGTISGTNLLDVSVIANHDTSGAGSVTVNGNVTTGGGQYDVAGEAYTGGSYSVTTGGGIVDITANSGSLSTGTIDTQSSTNGGNVTVTANSGEVSVNGGITTDGTSGNAGIIGVTAGASGTSAMSIAGAISAEGTSSVADTDYITLTADSGTMTLGGSITASGSSDANITVSADTVVIDDQDTGTEQLITGNTIDITSTNNALQLKQSLKLDALTDAAIHGDIDYNGIGGAGDLTILADNDATFAVISDGDTSAGTDVLNVRITANHDVVGVGSVTGTGNITTQGGLVNMSGVAVTTGSIDTQGVAPTAAGNGTNGGNITLASTSGNVNVGGTLNSNGSGALGDGTTAYTGGTAGQIGLTSTTGNVILGGDAQAIGGAGADGSVVGSGTEGNGNTIAITNLALDASRTIEAGNNAGVSITGNAIDYNPLTADGTLTVNAGDDITIDGISDGDTGTADLLNVSLTANTDGNATGGVTINNGITTQGGFVKVDGLTITTAAIDTRGNSDQIGGEVVLSASALTGTGINVGNITTGGGGVISNDSDGMSGGNITINSESSDIFTGAIDTTGSDANSSSNDRDGGAAGTVGLYTLGDVTVGTVTANGGARARRGSDGIGGKIVVAGSVDLSGDPVSPSGVVGMGAITAKGAAVTVYATSINVASIDTQGVSPASYGVGTDGGGISLTSTSGDISVAGTLNSSGGNAKSNSNTYVGGDAGVININSNGDINLGGNVSAVEGTGINGGADGLGANITLTSGQYLQITDNLKIESGAGTNTGAADSNVTINGDVSYSGLTSAATLELIAGDDVKLNGDIVSGGNTNQLNVSLTANNDGLDVGDVTVIGNITTTGTFDASGVDYDARSDADNVYTITAGNTTIDMSGDVYLGGMTVNGTLDVTASGLTGISQGVVNASADVLSVSGVSAFETTMDDATITLGNANSLQGDISLTSTGTSYSDITLYNSAANTTLGAVDVYGDLVVVAEGNLTVNGTITGYDTDGASPGTSLTLDFAQQNRVNEHTFDLAATGSITRDSGTIGLAINGAAGADTFNLQSGSIDQNFSAMTIDGLAGADTFNLGIDINGTVQGGSGNDIFNISNADTISITNLRGGDHDVGTPPAGDTLVGDNNNNQWNITGPGSGNINGTGGIVFSEIENLTGGDGNDTFSFEESGSVIGGVDGIIQAGLGTDTVDYSGQTTVVVDLTDAYNGVVDAEVIRGNGSDSTLIGGNVANTWDVTGINSGTVGLIDFEGFNNLTGGSDIDTFTFYAADIPGGHPNDGSITGIIDGAGGSDIADYSDQTGATVYLSGMQNIESVIGDGTATLVAEDGINTWQLYAPTTGGNTVTDNTSTGIDTTTVVFTGFSNLTGGSENDTFVINEAGAGTEQIDGGNGTGTDTMDYSALATVSVDLNTATFSNIEQLVGNGSDSTLVGDNTGDTWNVMGNNSGNITGATTIAFTNFNVLQGGTGNDIFNVQSSGSVGDQASPDTDAVSGIFGGNGDDELNVTFGGASRSIRFDGGLGSDTINLDGGAATYSGEYISNPVVAYGAYERLAYTAGSNTDMVNYIGAETVNDNVIATDFTVNGTVGDDTVVLNGNAYQVNSSQQVNFSGKESLLIDGLTGVADTIGVSGNLSIGGTLHLAAESVTNSSGSGMVSADTLVLDGVSAVGSSGAQLSTDIGHLSIINASGGVYVTDDSADGVIIDSLSNFSGDLFLIANNGNITDGAALISAANMRLETGNGHIVLNDANQLTGALGLSVGSTNTISLTNNANTNLSNTVAGGLTVNTQGTLTGTMDVGSLSVTNAQSVDLDNGTRSLEIAEVNSSGNVSVHAGTLSDIDNVVVSGNANFESDNGVGISSITSTNGTVSVTASNGQILANASGTNITAESIVLSATTGIGDSVNALTTYSGGSITNPGHLNVQSSDGLIQMNNTGNVLIEMMSTTSDNIVFDNTGTVIIDRIETNTDDPGATSINKVTVVTHDGSILGYGGEPAHTEADADIAAYSVNLVANNGNIGAGSRPLVIWAEGGIDTYGLVSFGTVFLPESGNPDRINDTSVVSFSASETLAALSGEQVREVDDLDDVDPAIFTEVHNYNLSEVSIKMPRDQRYGDELEQ